MPASAERLRLSKARRATALESRFAGEGEKRFEKKHLSRFGPSPPEQQEAVKDLTEFLTGARMPDGFTKHEARVQLLADKAKEYGSLAKALGEVRARLLQRCVPAREC